GLSNKVSLFGWYQDKSNYVEVLMKQEHNQWLIRQKIGGKWLVKTKGAATITPNVSYDVKVIFDGTNFQLFVDGTLLVTMKAAGPAQGTVGFQVKNTTGTFGMISVN